MTYPLHLELAGRRVLVGGAGTIGEQPTGPRPGGRDGDGTAPRIHHRSRARPVAGGVRRRVSGDDRGRRRGRSLVVGQDHGTGTGPGDLVVDVADHGPVVGGGMRQAADASARVRRWRRDAPDPPDQFPQSQQEHRRSVSQALPLVEMGPSCGYRRTERGRDVGGPEAPGRRNWSRHARTYRRRRSPLDGMGLINPTFSRTSR